MCIYIYINIFLYTPCQKKHNLPLLPTQKTKNSEHDIFLGPAREKKEIPSFLSPEASSVQQFCFLQRRSVFYIHFFLDNEGQCVIRHTPWGSG